MSIEEILSLWEVDSRIDSTNLGAAARDAPQLHHRYWKLLLSCRRQLRSAEADLKRLRLRKYEFYTQGPAREDRVKLPPQGKILKADAQKYVEADPEVQEKYREHALLQDEHELLESILQKIGNFSHLVHNALEWEKFSQGVR
jgi:Recombination, repair and ssDNA binding protein UvsY